MKKFMLFLSVLLLVCSVALIYITRHYALFSVLYLLSWILFLVNAAYFQRRKCALFASACWFLIMLGLLPALIRALEAPNLPQVLDYARQALYALLVLPLAGLPSVRFYGAPMALIFCAAGIAIYYFLRRADSAPLKSNDMATPPT